MSYGNLAPWLRRVFGREPRFGTGSLVFDMERQRRRGGQDGTDAPERKTRLFPGL